MKELLDSIIEFLEDNLGENYIWITVGAAVLVVVIIALIAAAARKKTAAAGQDAQRDFFLEGEYDALIRESALAAKAAGKSAEQAEPTEQPADTGAEPVPEPEAQPETEPEAQPEQPAEVPAETEPTAEDVAEVPAEEQDALKEELQQVHININIERGQVRIGYEEDGKVTCIVETDDDECGIHEAEPELTAALAAGEISTDADDVKMAEGGGLPDSSGIILEKINLVKAAPAKKFGPDNFNTGRSGRVFTEEELREQIKQ